MVSGPGYHRRPDLPPPAPGGPPPPPAGPPLTWPWRWAGHPAAGAHRPAGPADFPPVGPGSLASVWRRAWARLTDSALVDAPVLVATGLVTGFGTLLTAAPAWAVAVNLLIPAVYEVVFLAWRGQTVGKILWGVRVCRLADGGIPRPDRAAMRVALPAAVGLVGSWVLPGAFLVVYLAALWHPLRQGWHDRAADTVVVSVR